MGKHNSSDRKIGRPRDLALRKTIFQATMKLLQKMSVRDLTIEAIAREAEVGKTTIYRWWSSKALVVIDAFMESHISSTPMPRSVDPKKALERHILSLIAYFRSRSGAIVAEIIAEGQFEPSVIKELNQRFVANRRNLVLDVFLRGQEKGVFRNDIPAEIALEMLYAPIYRRLIFGLRLDNKFGRDLVAGLRLFATENAAKNLARKPFEFAGTRKHEIPPVPA